MSKNHKPTIETMMNTTALALTSFAVVSVTTAKLVRASAVVVTLTTGGTDWNNIIKGIIILFVGMSLEFAKYWGRDKLW